MTSDENLYAQMGMAALLPGMVRMLDLMQQQVSELQAQLASGENAEPKRQVGRPPRKKARTSPWTNMSAEDRSIEMKRRQAVARAKREGAVVPAEPEVDVERLHPRDPRSPRHERWRKRVSKGRKRNWAEMSPRARNARLAKMAAGRSAAAAQRVNGAAL